jgi:glycosyltransferase involved in cell wall biosynthesis
MRIVLFSTYVPFVEGGARFIVEWLKHKLLEYGHEAEHVYAPFSDQPQHLLAQMIAFRSLRIERADRVICFRPPAHLLRHPNKVLWFIHHFRGFYDLWKTEFAPPPTLYNQALRKAIFRADELALGEARAVFTNSRVVRDRVKKFNGVDASVLYPPILDPSIYKNTGYGDEVVYISRLVSHKRQHLLVQAMAHTRTGVKVRICGTDAGQGYADTLKKMALEYGVEDRVSIESRWISDEQKLEMIGRCLALAYFPLDEDSYGYPSLEGAHCHKPLLTTFDSGGVREFAVHERNGFVCKPDPKAIAQALDRLYNDRKLVEQMGDEAYRTIDKMGINWDNVIEHLLA